MKTLTLATSAAICGLWCGLGFMVYEASDIAAEMRSFSAGFEKPVATIPNDARPVVCRAQPVGPAKCHPLTSLNEVDVVPTGTLKEINERLDVAKALIDTIAGIVTAWASIYLVVIARRERRKQAAGNKGNGTHTA